MANLNNVRKGMQVYTGDRQFGTVEDIYDNYLMVNGQQFSPDQIQRIEGNRVYLAGNTNKGQYGQQNANEIRMPVAEEQLNVGKRQVDGGAVRVHKEVVSEQQNVPVELRREEAHIEKRDLPDRPLREGEAAFQEGTFDIPLRAEEAVVSKDAIVTGEVVVNKTQQTETRQVGDTIRKERVQVDRVDQPATRNTGYEATSTPTGNTTGYQNNAAYATTPGQTQTYNNGGQIQEGFTVYGSDEDKLGKVKSVDENGILVSRGFLQGDTYVPFSAISNVNQDQVVLNLPAEQVDSMDWQNSGL